MMLLTGMMHIQGASAKVFMAYRSYHPTVLFTRRITFLAPSLKQLYDKDVYSVCGKLRMRVSSSEVKCRLKSDTTVNAVDHLVELGMPQSADDVQRLTENIASRNMNINIGDLVRLLWLSDIPWPIH